ncbi:MAG: substrate-binding domain-containing protein [Chloroflexota bacterium]|nr:substrate-binding domain-containing protein [Chloroflexota bacterium]
MEIAAIEERLQMPQPPTAIFAMNDLTALLALKAASLAHLSVPRDLSLVGFDDMDFVAFLPVPLTSVAQDPFALGRRAAELLIERIEGHEGPPRMELLPTRLKVRATTAPLAS